MPARTLRFLKPRIRLTLLSLSIIAAIALILTASVHGPSQTQERVTLPGRSGKWHVQNPRTGRLAANAVRLSIQNVGSFLVPPESIVSMRPDIFQPDHFSVFDLLVALDAADEIELESHYDEAMATHIVDSINGESGWWYRAWYNSGWREDNSHRMDQYPVQDGTQIELYRERASRLATLYEELAAETERLAANGGQVVVPHVVIEDRRGNQLLFENVAVTAHNTRIDLFQPGTITALDILLSLGEQGHLDSLELTWYDSIGTADPVDHYFVEGVEGPGMDADASGSCGFVYEVGYDSLRGFDGAHIHVPADARVLVSPEYALWFWICL